MTANKDLQPQITLALPAGRMGAEHLDALGKVARRYNLTAYMTTMQNIRLLGAQQQDIDSIKQALTAAGITIKQPGTFPLPKVCVGQPYCKLALTDIATLSAQIMAAYGARTGIKPKIKIALAACPASCSGAFLVDIGVVATRSGYDIYAGGKGGPRPLTGRRIVKGATAAHVVEVIGQLVDFHQQRTTQKQRMCKLLDDPEFPFSITP